MTADELYMQRALDLSLLGHGTARPNPVVGCVVVHEGRIIGEGWHRQYGGPHAEVNAINSVEDKSLLPQSTVYVTLEPCSHFGKTPPCADLLVQERVQRVVICNQDPNPEVSGRGISKLRDAGIEVEVGVLHGQGRYLNRRFFTFMERQRPYVLLKWAQTADGFIARPDNSSRWISGELSRKLVHKWRTEEQAILVGPNTALHDNPQLTAREWPGPQPLRLVVDRQLRLPTHLHLFDKSHDTWVYTNRSDGPSDARLQYLCLREEREEFLPAMLHNLWKRQVQSVLVEGGSGILTSLIRSGLWDEARIFTAPSRFGSGIAAPQLPLHQVTEETLVGEDRLSILMNGGVGEWMNGWVNG